jgi:hypothetical protein
VRAGADIKPVNVPFGARELPPRARGRLLKASRGPVAARAIPAFTGPTRARGSRRCAAGGYSPCVGPTACTPSRTSAGRTYPRVRRADIVLRSLNDDTVRSICTCGGGDWTLPARDRARVGAVPADAGPTSTGGRTTCRSRSYPCLRGADSLTVSSKSSALELSSRARAGPTPRVPVVVTRDGAVPACAGPTTRAWSTSRRPSSYPRVRRANSLKVSRRSSALELSPHARG